MKITGIMAIKDGIVGGFPFLEGILSVLPIVDEFLVADGGSFDGTLQALNRLQQVFPEKIKLIKDSWVPTPNCENIDGSLDKLVSLAEGDWIINVQGDEIWHEKDVQGAKGFVEAADKSSCNGIRVGCIEAKWFGLDTVYCKGSTYKTIRIFRKQSNLKLFRAGDDVFVDPDRTIREGFTSSNLPPELDSDFGFYHFHRVFPENTHTADKFMMDEMAFEAMDRKFFYPPPVYQTSEIYSDLPEVMKGLAYKPRYEVREELFDRNWLSKVTGLNYQKEKFVEVLHGGLIDEEKKPEDFGGMELLKNFELDGFMRMVWLNKKAKEAWSPVISSANALVHEMEVESVVINQRPCAWVTVDERNYPQAKANWESKNLNSLVLRKVGQFQGFANKFIPPRPNEPGMFCCIVSKSMDELAAFKDAASRADDFTQGILLGYGECCAHFFVDIWLRGYHDPIWQTALNSQIVNQTSCHIRVKPHPLSNPMLRFAGVRAGFHIPCSFNCQETIRISKERFVLAKEFDFELVEKMEELLRMPMSWDCYHGVAIIRTPIFYLVVPSCASMNRYVVEIEGDYIPSEAEKGLVYPNNLI